MSAAASIVSPRRKGRTTTEYRLDAEEVTLEANTEKVCSWISVLCGSDQFESRDKFFDSIANGVLMMDLIEKLYPQHKIKLQRKARPASFHARDNISKVIESLTNIGLAKNSTNVYTPEGQNDMFLPDDLVDRKKDKAVIGTLLSLRELAKSTGVDVFEQEEKEDAATDTRDVSTIEEEPSADAKEQSDAHAFEVKELRGQLVERDEEIKALKERLSQYEELYGDLEPFLQNDPASQRSGDICEMLSGHDIADVMRDVKPDQLPIRNRAYYHDVSRKAAEEELFSDVNVNPVGRYLFRPCNDKKEYVNGKPNKNLYVLTFVDKTFAAQHVKVFQHADGFKRSQDEQRLCPSVEDFFKVYTPAARTPVNKDA